MKLSSSFQQYDIPICTPVWKLRSFLEQHPPGLQLGVSLQFRPCFISSFKEVTAFLSKKDPVLIEKIGEVSQQGNTSSRKVHHFRNLKILR
jgi:hypothetical protein